MNWTDCRKSKNLVKEVSPDNNLIQSLIKSSAKKEHSFKLLILDENTASSKVSLAYDSLRELLEAIALLKGYKIYNHECYASFIKEELNQSQLGEDFDKFRKARNAINYYGKDITPVEAEYLLGKMNAFMDRIKLFLR
ncbi:hypothetical protein HYY74_01810 [Candidatus Woesearchaeota archaeon]|nr:hypothetical protein [Candidatus Woesearchaeota archaeon]